MVGSLLLSHLSPTDLQVSSFPPAETHQVLYLLVSVSNGLSKAHSWQADLMGLCRHGWQAILAGPWIASNAIMLPEAGHGANFGCG